MPFILSKQNTTTQTTDNKRKTGLKRGYFNFKGPGMLLLLLLFLIIIFFFFFIFGMVRSNQKNIRYGSEIYLVKLKFFSCSGVAFCTSSYPQTHPEESVIFFFSSLKEIFSITHFNATLHTQTWTLHWSIFPRILCGRNVCPKLRCRRPMAPLPYYNIASKVHEIDCYERWT